MYTPYDWQEGIGNRAQYIEGKLAQGVPVLAVSLEEGILAFTYHRQAQKIYEIYDRLMFAGIGQQSDVEALRTAAVDFAHQEGYNRSEQDVTIQRVATAMSGPLKKAFSDFSASPLIARTMFAEVGETSDQDCFYLLDYDGDYSIFNHYAILTGSDSALAAYDGKLRELSAQTADQALERLRDIWKEGFATDDKPLEEAMHGLKPEAVLFERSMARENHFRILED